MCSPKFLVKYIHKMLSNSFCLEHINVPFMVSESPPPAAYERLSSLLPSQVINYPVKASVFLPYKYPQDPVTKIFTDGSNSFLMSPVSLLPLCQHYLPSDKDIVTWRKPISCLQFAESHLATTPLSSPNTCFLFALFPTKSVVCSFDSLWFPQPKYKVQLLQCGCFL